MRNANYSHNSIERRYMYKISNMYGEAVRGAYTSFEDAVREAGKLEKKNGGLYFVTMSGRR